MEKEIIEIICKYQGIDSSMINRNSNLILDLGLSSFDVISLICEIEEKFDVEIPDRKIREFKTVNDVVDFINQNI